MKNKKESFTLAVLIILIFASMSIAAIPFDVIVGQESVLTLKETKRWASIADSTIADIKGLCGYVLNEDGVETNNYICMMTAKDKEKKDIHIRNISIHEIFLTGKKPGVTSLIVWDNTGKTFFDVIVMEKLDRDVTYGNKIKALRNEIKAVAPNDDIRVSLANDTIVLSGDATNQETINKVVQMAQAYAIASDITTSTKYSAGVTTTESTTTAKVLNHIRIKEAQQVLLEVRVAQIDKSKLKELGVSFLIKGSDAEGFSNLAGTPIGILGDGTTFSKASLGDTSSVTGGTNTSTNTTTFDNILGKLTSDILTTTVGNTTTNTAGNTSIAGRTRDSSITGFDLSTLAPQIGVSYFPGGVSVILKALATKGLAKILAEPNMVVRSGEKGEFLAGKEVPIQVVTGTPPTPSIEYRDVGIKLNFAPEVLETGVIRLKIDPAEVSSISKYIVVGSLIAPEIDTRSVKTSVDLKEGESLILAGLLSEEMIKNMQKIPILGDIPILGALFRSTHDELAQKELAFFITPKLVKPIPPGVKTELPGDNRPTPEEERELQWIPLPPPSSDTSSQAPAKDKDPRDYPVW